MRLHLFFSSAFFVASSVFIPQVNADMRNEFNQQQTQQQKMEQERKELCSSLLAKAQFKSEKEILVQYYYVTKPNILQIQDVSKYGSYAGKYCLITKHPYLGTPQNYKDVGNTVGTYTTYIEDGVLVQYLKNSLGEIHRVVVGVKK